jgi:hypothetical protein
VRSISKYLLAALVTVAVAAVAVFVAVNVELLAGAVVVLGALIIVALVGRMRASRAEKAGMADWAAVLDADAPADAFFSDWTRTSPGDAVPTPDLAEPAWAAAADDAPPASWPDVDPEPQGAPKPAPVVEVHLEAPVVEPVVEPVIDTAFAEPPQSEVVSTALGSTSDPVAEVGAEDVDHDEDVVPDRAEPAAPSPFPFEDDGFGELLSSAGSAPDPRTFAPEQDYDDPAPQPPTTPVPYTSPLDVPSADLADYFATAAPEAPPFADELTVTVTTGSTEPSAGATDRRPLIDWTGPTRIVEDRVRTSDDILAASAATALPTATVDRPAPAAGSELSRLLAKVEARLREYD